MGPDNRKGAKSWANTWPGASNGNNPVAIIEGAPNAFNGVQRKAGL